MHLIHPIDKQQTVSSITGGQEIDGSSPWFTWSSSSCICLALFSKIPSLQHITVPATTSTTWLCSAETKHLEYVLYLSSFLTLCMDKPDSINSEYVVPMIIGIHQVLKTEALQGGLTKIRQRWVNLGHANSYYVTYTREKSPILPFLYKASLSELSYTVSVQVSFLMLERQSREVPQCLSDKELRVYQLNCM